MRIIAAIVALVFAPAAGAAFKCVDEKGITHFGDTPPAGCARVVMLEVSPSGRVLRRIDPTPTPEQLKVREEEARQQREADKLAAERKRKDLALITTFASEKEFDVARDRNIEPLNGRIRSAQERIKDVDKRLAKIEEEMEFYKAGKSKSAKAQTREVPIGLTSEQERLAREKETLLAGIAASEREIVAQRERFERDKQRWVELKTGVVAKPVEGPKGPTTVTLSAGGAGRAVCGDKIYECPAGETYACYDSSTRRVHKVACVVERK